MDGRTRTDGRGTRIDADGRGRTDADGRTLTDGRLGENFRGVDLSDQMLWYYSPGRPSPRWHRSVFYHQLNKVLLNAFHNQASVHGYGTGSRYKRQLMFRAEVARQLIGNFSSRRRATRGVRVVRPGPATADVQNVEHAVHELGRNPAGTRGCAMCRRAGRVSGHGTRPNRPHETRFWCTTCQVPVCRPTNREVCWREHNI